MVVNQPVLKDRDRKGQKGHRHIFRKQGSLHTLRFTYFRVRSCTVTFVSFNLIGTPYFYTIILVLFISFFYHILIVSCRIISALISYFCVFIHQNKFLSFNY